MTDKTILIADDDPELVHALALRCRVLGLHVQTAHDATTAWIQIRETPPDLVCLDVTMPYGNGLSVCEMLASDPDRSGIPVIILTGRCDEDVVRRCHSLCAYYVPKCENLWPRIEPLLCDLLEVPRALAGSA